MSKSEQRVSRVERQVGAGCQDRRHISREFERQLALRCGFAGRDVQQSFGARTPVRHDRGGRRRDRIEGAVRRQFIRLDRDGYALGRFAGGSKFRGAENCIGRIRIDIGILEYAVEELLS
ncbi:hypothetical protein [Cryobacterium sp. TMT4-31]|uniref:hypothetical protein n=1 Tax=Cryobacterium sp. TMT4-31 TaxID=1259259 RepID=UPI001069DA99|nr:hypothetical protein [Cryobacterium sp. TMT4-31]TFC86343.1 hypothetical protein E3T19_15280 [Cryobacterium sp. TMT4-31]